MQFPVFLMFKLNFNIITHISVKFFRVQNFIDFQLIINNLKKYFIKNNFKNQIIF